MDLVAPACIPIPGLQGNGSHYQCKYSAFFSRFPIPVFARLCFMKETDVDCVAVD